MDDNRTQAQILREQACIDLTRQKLMRRLRDIVEISCECGGGSMLVRCTACEILEEMEADDGR